MDYGVGMFETVGTRVGIFDGATANRKKKLFDQEEWEEAGH